MRKCLITNLLVESATDGTESTALLVQEVNECLLASGTLVRDGLRSTLGEELDRRETADTILLFERSVHSGVGVDVGDNTLHEYNGKVQWANEKLTRCVRSIHGGNLEQPSRM